MAAACTLAEPSGVVCLLNAVCVQVGFGIHSTRNQRCNGAGAVSVQPVAFPCLTIMTLMVLDLLALMRASLLQDYSDLTYIRRSV